MVFTQKHIQIKKSLLTLIESNPIIIKMEVFENEFLEVEDVKEIREANLKLSDGKPFCVLCDTSKGYFNTSPGAFKLLAGKVFSEKRIATAFVAKSLATKIASNFFIRFNKPPTPTRVFSSENEAMKWLKTFTK